MTATLWKMPPLVKVYEALGALGDGRVRIEDEGHASVVSSDGSKTYQVEISPDGREISSNDNASYWQGYLGYPAIAVLLARGLYYRRPPDSVVRALAGIPWKELNRRFRNDYEKTIDEVIRRLEKGGHDSAAVRAEAEAVLEALRRRGAGKGPRGRRAPREKAPHGS
jgi:hypothetical protein